METRVSSVAACVRAALALVILLSGSLAAFPPVFAVREQMTIPTYEMGPPETNPIFYTRESYQGAQKRIYPYPFQDNLSHVKKEKAYTALRLENEYIRVVILPEIGGHLFEALDRTNNYDFLYRQHVIKPALIGMLGAWISGGIEWCAFHHHRNTTFMPVDSAIAENPDGSKTIWIGETERRHRMRWLIGISLHPERSYIEASVTFFNRTPVPHSILNWANVAVHVNDSYQIIFPPSVTVATYHSKTDFTQWPISSVTYRGVDYRGVDLSWWKNHPEPVSFFAWNLREDFMGGYDHGKEAGVVHVADHHLVCGAKLWEWGTGPFGRMWDTILTDEDGPYAELMVGAFSDNQPDYSWIKPYEVKTFKQYWYPIRAIGGFKRANLEGAVNLELGEDGIARFGFHTTAAHRAARIALRAAGRVLSETIVDIDPARPFTKKVPVPSGTRRTDLRASLADSDGREIIAYQPVEPAPPAELPKPVTPPPPPESIASSDELYFTALRVEQIHSPSVDPIKYYEEAVKRDSGDARSNTMLGLHYVRRGMWNEAELHLRRALERATAQYTRPASGEAHYYLGLALRGRRQWDAAYDQFYRASWDQAMHAAAYCQLAELSCRAGEFARALAEVDRSLTTSALNTKALNLRAAILRRLGRPEDAELLADRTLATDPLDFGAMNEKRLAQLAAANAGTAGKKADARRSHDALAKAMRGEVQSYLELATDYIGAGLIDEAMEVLERATACEDTPAKTYPLVYYYLGYLLELKGDARGAANMRAQAARMPPDYCFPFRLETIDVLESALKANPGDARALYYRGNLLYEIQPDRAIECWEKSRELDGGFATVHRNLGWGYYRIKNTIAPAIESYERAIACASTDPRLFLELDTLYEFANVPSERRLALLEKHRATVRSRNESFIREIGVLVLVGKHDEAIDALANNFFHVREGGGEIHDIYVDAHLLKGIELARRGDHAGALAHFTKAAEYPENLSVGRPKNDRRAPQVAYYTGTAHEALGDAAKASESYERAAAHAETARSAETRFYQALCLKKLERGEEASKILDELAEKGRKDLAERETSDFFAKFGEQETKQARTAAAHLSLGLAALGRGDREAAREELAQAAALNRSNPWARHHLTELEAGAGGR